MARIQDKLLDLSNTVPFVDAAIHAYLASDQPTVLTNLDGTPQAPIGTAVASTETNNLGQYELTGLTPGVVYDLYVIPAGGYPFWLPGRLPDAEITATPCILYGTVDGALDLVWAFLEFPAMVSGGVYIVNGTVYSPVSESGAFSLSLWPTSTLTPAALYRVIVGGSVYRGSVPDQSSILLSDWLGLDTTIQVS
jgi:hypothetical protein